MRERNIFEKAGRNAVIADLESYNWTIVNKTANSAQNVLLAIKGKEKLVVLISTTVERILTETKSESYRKFIHTNSFKGGIIMYEAKVHLDQKLKKQRIEFVKMSV
ncbi:MAG: hypothetical protein JEY97_10995 [Bacteroidales bacterium]|nr:hypothetical protein [Bacteroidales bacterium]